MTIAVVHCFVVPYIISFHQHYFDEILLITVMTIIDISFIVDIFINFRTSYVNKDTGEEIFDLRKISIHYFKGKFIIDIISAIPFEYFALIFVESQSHALWLKLIGFAKLTRVAQLGEIITHLNLKNDIKTSFRLAKLVFFIFLFIH